MKNDIHILLISSWYPNEQKPFLGNFIQRQSELLATKYKVTVIDTISDSNLNDIQLNSVNKGNLTEVQVKHPRGRHIFQRRKHQKKALKTAMEGIGKVDLVIGSILLPKGLQFIQAKKHFACPLIYIEHGSYFRPEVSESWKQIYRLIWKKVSFNVDAIVAVSEFLKKDLQGFFPKHKINVIGNHVDLKLFEAKEKTGNDKTQFLHVSTLDFQTKKPEGIIEACEKLKSKSDNFNLTIVCDEDISEWEELVAKKNLKSNITFVGPLEWKELVPYYQQADAFVLFSTYETFSIVLVEAWLTGTPTITTPVGVAWSMPESNGMIVSQNNSDELADSMLKFINNEIQFNSSEIREHAKQFGSEKILIQWMELIEQYVK